MGNLLNVVEKTIAMADARKQRAQFFDDPAAWAEYMLDVYLWDKQASIAESVVHNKSTAVKAGHGVGKSYLVAILICWWIDTRYPNVFVASTAPSQKQIGAIVWRYVRQIKNQVSARYKDGIIDHELPGYITADNEWKEVGGNILGFGRKPPENKEDDSFQGIHDAYVLAVGDEAVGLTEAMIDALGNITSNEGSRRILICNPTNPASYIGKLFKEKVKNWVFHTISVFDSPNFRPSEAKKLSKEALAKLVGPSYVEEKRVEYGEDSPRFKSRVRGEFAYDLGDTLIKPEDVAVAVDNVIEPGLYEPRILGVDVARFGGDSSVIYFNHGGKIRFVAEMPEGRTTETARWVHQHAIDLGADQVRIDSLGIGGAVVDFLMDNDEFTPHYTVIEMNANAQSPDRKKWHNARAYWWDKFRQYLRESNLDLDNEDEKHERLEDELLSVEYKFNAQSGGLLVESKDDMRKRGMKSPDFADAAIYAGADLTFLLDDPLAGHTSGDKVRQSPEDIIGASMPHYLTILSQF
jgi:hypothetical protein